MHKRNVQRLRAFIRAPSEHLLAKKFDFADCVAGCLHATMAACVYTSYMYTSYMIVYASTFRSIMLLLCYDVLRCPSKCTSCTYYIVVLHVYTYPPPCMLPHQRRIIRHRPSTLQRQSAARNYDSIKRGKMDDLVSRIINVSMDLTSITFQSLSITGGRLTNSAFTPLDRNACSLIGCASLQPRVTRRRGMSLILVRVQFLLRISQRVSIESAETQQIRATTNV